MTTDSPERHRALRGRCVLLADGPESSRARYADALRRAGATVHSVGSARGARIAWADPPDGRAFDVAVVGFAFPDADGPSVAAALRSAGGGRPVVGVTACGSSEQGGRWRSGGCALVLPSSTAADSLAAGVVALVGQAAD